MSNPPPKRRGRPRVDPADASASVSVHVRMSAKQYDRLYAEAVHRKIKLSDLVRAAVTARLRQP